MKTVTEEKLKKYFKVTEKALKKVKINKSYTKQATKILNMAELYYQDAKHFRKKGDFVTAFAALNYAHGWLDAGSHLGFFDVDDDKLFVLKD